MYGLVCASVAGASFFLYTIVRPVYLYLADSKGLRRYPQLSWFSGISDLPFVMESHRGFRSEKLHKIHRQGKPVVRIGPNSLSYGDIQAIQDIYGHSTPCLKDDQYNAIAGSHRNMADVVDKKDHARKRKILSGGFADKNLENWEWKVSQKLERLIAQFDKRCDARDHAPSKVDVRAFTNFYTIDCLVDICVSKDIDCISRGDDSVTAEQLDGYTYTTKFRDCNYAIFESISTFLWSYDWFQTLKMWSRILQPSLKELDALSNGFSDLIHHLSELRWKEYEKGDKIDDIFCFLMEDGKGNHQNLPWGEVEAEIGLLVSGSSSTSNGIAEIITCLLNNPETMNRLRAELDSTLDPEDAAAPYDKVRHLPYLRACIDEGLRLYPSISHGLPRTTPKEGARIRGEWVPGDTTVAISAYVAHRDPEAFPDPHAYKPERWLGQEGKRLQPYYLAFSAGARGCIGRPISYMMLTTLIATLFHRYDFGLPHPGWEPSRKETMNLIVGPMPLTVAKRQIDI